MIFLNCAHMVFRDSSAVIVVSPNSSSPGKNRSENSCSAPTTQVLKHLFYSDLLPS